MIIMMIIVILITCSKAISMNIIDILVKQVVKQKHMDTLHV